MILADFENSWCNRINKRWWKIWWKQRTSVFEYSLNSIIKIGLYDFTDSTISKLVHYEFNCSWHRLNHTGWYRLKNALVWTCLNQLEPVIKINSELTLLYWHLKIHLLFWHQGNIIPCNSLRVVKIQAILFLKSMS